MATTTNYSWTTPDDTALVKDGAAAIRSLGTAIDTTVFNNAGAAIAKSIVDAKGDLIAGTADNTVARLAVGTNGHTLVADSSQATGLKWAAPASSAKILQVVYGSTSTAVSTSSTSYADTGLSASITPTSASNDIYVFINHNGCAKSVDDAEQSVFLRLMKGATELTVWGKFIGYQSFAKALYGLSASLIYKDSPATTSATTYKTQYRASAAAQFAAVQYDNSLSTIVLMEVVP